MNWDPCVEDPPYPEHHFQNAQNRGTVTTSYDNEYLTSTLKSNVSAGLLTDTVPVCYAHANLDSTETSYSATSLTYHFDFTVPSSKYYKITWDEVFTPDTGTPTTTPMSWTFNDLGATVGATESSPDNTIAVPSSNGITTIDNIVISCLRPS